MSVRSPVYGVDVHPVYQDGFAFGKAKQQGYGYAWVKASQADSYRPDGFIRMCKTVPTDMQLGFYHFLDRTATGEEQALWFLECVRLHVRTKLLQGVMLAVDFEGYADLTATNTQLKDFISVVKRHTDNHAVVLYSGVNFWNSGTPTGAFSQYGADVAWEARYPDMLKHRFPKMYYQAVRRWYGWNTSLGGTRAHFWQFTSRGRVANMNVDVNAFRGTVTDLKALSGRSVLQ